MSKIIRSIPAVTLVGRNVVVTQTGTISYTATTIINTGDPNGFAQFSIYNYIDLAGNSGVTQTTTTDGSFVLIGNVPRTIRLKKN